MTPEYWIGLGTALLIIGTVMVTWGTMNSMKIVVASTTVIKDATDKLQTQTQKIEGINNEIATKASQISNLVSESLNQLTSADSFCYVEASLLAPKGDEILFFIVHHGKYPVSDINIEVHDVAVVER